MHRMMRQPTVKGARTGPDAFVEIPVAKVSDPVAVDLAVDVARLVVVAAVVAEVVVVEVAKIMERVTRREQRYLMTSHDHISAH